MAQFAMIPVPGAVENIEVRGQRDLVRGSQLSGSHSCDMAMWESAS